MARRGRALRPILPSLRPLIIPLIVTIFGTIAFINSAVLLAMAPGLVTLSRFPAWSLSPTSFLSSLVFSSVWVVLGILWATEARRKYVCVRDRRWCASSRTVGVCAGRVVWG